ncbi:hypothetical protein INT43_001088 [Umbelopsis isabellina]|uniref:RRM domain-containing protein n=1 Tax=Mortierella isabellina TaxID=91625 RepID=A0A8H7PLJ5_MORIS|nr:hypothetical protein INT43_001088 [Umbelopsis isabellina]
MESSDIEHCTRTQDRSSPAKTNGTETNSHLSEDHIVNNINHARGRPASCIFVASLSKLLKDSELCHSVAQHFAQWGTVLNVKVFRDWMQRPYGFVQFEVGGPHNSIICLDSSIYGEIAHFTEHMRRSKSIERSLRTIYLGGMSNHTKKKVPFSSQLPNTLAAPHIDLVLPAKDIQSFAENFGGVENITLIKLSLKQPPAVDAFIRFHYRDDAVKAYLAIAADPPFQAVVVEWAANVNYSNDDPCDVPEQYFSSIVYVKNLPFHAKQEAIYNRFGRYGTIVSVAIIGRKPFAVRKKLGNTTQCCAYVHYKTQEEAVCAQEGENGSSMQGRTLQVTLAHDSNLSSGNGNNKTQHPSHTNDRKHQSKILYAAAKYSKPQEDYKANGMPIQSLNKNYLEKRHQDKYVTESGATLPLYPYTNGYQGSTRLRVCKFMKIQLTKSNHVAANNLMQYPPTHANPVDYSGMCYSMPPMYPYCLDYGNGYYYNTGYGYNGTFYSAVMPYPAATVASRHRH